MPPGTDAPASDALRLIVVAGTVASGKSTVARALAERLGAEHLEADRIRSTLLTAAAAGEDLGAEARWRRDLSPDFEREIYADLLRRAGGALERGRPVVVDACFPRRAQRRAVRALAHRTGARFLVVECRVADAVLRRRLAERDRQGAHDGWSAIQARLAERTEPIDELGPDEHLRIDGAAPMADSIASVEAHLARPAAARAAPAIAPLPRAVSFDCWSTLIAEDDWPWAHALRVRALRDAAREAGREVSDAVAETAFDTAWQRHMKRWQAGRASGAPEVARWGLEVLGVADSRPALERLVHRFEEASHTSRVVAVEGADALLAALDESDIPCVLVCDTGLTPGRVVRRLLDGLGLLEHLRVLAFSDEVGATKPDPRPFRAALDPLGVAPQDALHVGDLRRTDVAGARALGLRTVRIRARHDDASELPEADFVVDSHAQLATQLGLDPLVAEATTTRS